MLRLALETWGRPTKIIIDTWRKDKLKEILGNTEFPPTPIEVRRHGFLDGSEDIHEFRDAALDGHLFPIPSLILRSAVAEARTIMDAAGNTKITKSGHGRRRRSARDDAICAAIIAIAVGRRAANRPAAGPLDVGAGMSAGHHTKAWPRLRRRVLTRDRHTCQDCRRQGLGRVEVHHVNSTFEFGGTDDMSNLIYPLL